MSNTYKLIEQILENSEADTFETAKYEWAISDYEVNENEQCICGKTHIKYCYTIRNKINSNILFPVGSECIKKFERYDLSQSMKVFANKYTIFKNSGKKYDGKTFGYICENDPQYVQFLKENGKKKEYLKLVQFYDNSHK